MQGRVRKTLNICHIELNIHVTALSARSSVTEVALHASTQFATIALTGFLCTRCGLGADSTGGSLDVSSSSVEPACVTAEVNIVEEEQNMWRRIKKGRKFDLDAGRRSATMLSLLRVKPHFVSESLITATLKDALSRTPRQAFPPREFERDPEITQSVI